MYKFGSNFFPKFPKAGVAEREQLNITIYFRTYVP